MVCVHLLFAVRAAAAAAVGRLGICGPRASGFGGVGEQVDFCRADALCEGSDLVCVRDGVVVGERRAGRVCVFKAVVHSCLRVTQLRSSVVHNMYKYSLAMPDDVKNNNKHHRKDKRSSDCAYLIMQILMLGGGCSMGHG